MESPFACDSRLDGLAERPRPGFVDGAHGPMRNSELGTRNGRSLSRDCGFNEFAERAGTGFIDCSHSQFHRRARGQTIQKIVPFGGGFCAAEVGIRVHTQQQGPFWKIRIFSAAQISRLPGWGRRWRVAAAVARKRAGDRSAGRARLPPSPRIVPVEGIRARQDLPASWQAGPRPTGIRHPVSPAPLNDSEHRQFHSGVVDSE